MGQQVSARILVYRREYVSQGLCIPCASGAAIHRAGIETGEGSFPDYRAVNARNRGGVDCKCPTPTFPDGRPVLPAGAYEHDPRLPREREPWSDDE